MASGERWLGQRLLYIQICPQGLKPPASGSVDTYVKANLLPGASKVSTAPAQGIREGWADVRV